MLVHAIPVLTIKQVSDGGRDENALRGSPSTVEHMPGERQSLKQRSWMNQRTEMESLAQQLIWLVLLVEVATTQPTRAKDKLVKHPTLYICNLTDP